MKWTDEMTATAVRMRTVEGLSTTQIANAMGMTRSAIMGRLNRLGVIGTPPPTDDYKPRPRPLRLTTVGQTHDVQLFRSWEHRKMLRQMERDQGLPFRALS